MLPRCLILVGVKCCSLRPSTPAKHGRFCTNQEAGQQISAFYEQPGVDEHFPQEKILLGAAQLPLPPQPCFLTPKGDTLNPSYSPQRKISLLISQSLFWDYSTSRVWS